MPIILAGQLLRPPSNNGIQDTAALWGQPMASKPPTGSPVLHQSLHELPAAWMLIHLY